jgi:hypothetical protein
MKNSQDSNLVSIFRDLSQSKKLVEIKPPLPPVAKIVMMK